MLTLEDYERLRPEFVIDAPGRRLIYSTPSVLTKRRCETILTKEPATIEWIASFAPNDVLVDVGANVGLYTIWAAGTRQVRTFAFEPESQNYAILNRNIYVNDLAERITAYCMALSDRAGFGCLHLSEFAIGGSNHSFDQAVDFSGKPMAAAFAQGGVTATLDELVAGGIVTPPQYIKIDVDGWEPRVVRGAMTTIRQHVRSLLVEVNDAREDHRRMIAALADLGFRFDPAQVTQSMRKDGPFKGVAEYVFRR